MRNKNYRNFTGFEYITFIYSILVITASKKCIPFTDVFNNYQHVNGIIAIILVILYIIGIAVILLSLIENFYSPIVINGKFLITLTNIIYCNIFILLSNYILHSINIIGTFISIGAFILSICFLLYIIIENIINNWDS